MGSEPQRAPGEWFWIIATNMMSASDTDLASTNEILFMPLPRSLLTAGGAALCVITCAVALMHGTGTPALTFYAQRGSVWRNAVFGLTSGALWMTAVGIVVVGLALSVGADPSGAAHQPPGMQTAAGVTTFFLLGALCLLLPALALLTAAGRWATAVFFLILVRRWPVRSFAFLDHCHRREVLRVSGSGFTFRHEQVRAHVRSQWPNRPGGSGERP